MTVTLDVCVGAVLCVQCLADCETAKRELAGFKQEVLSSGVRISQGAYLSSFPDRDWIRQSFTALQNRELESLREALGALYRSVEKDGRCPPCTVRRSMYNVITPAAATSHAGDGLEPVVTTSDAVAAALVLATWQFATYLFSHLRTSLWHLTNGAFVHPSALQLPDGVDDAAHRLHYERVEPRPSTQGEAEDREVRSFHTDLTQRVIVHLQRGHRWLIDQLLASDAVRDVISTIHCGLPLMDDVQVHLPIIRMLELFWQMQCSRPQLTLHWDPHYSAVKYSLDEATRSKAATEVQGILLPVLLEAERVIAAGLIKGRGREWD